MRASGIGSPLRRLGGLRRRSERGQGMVEFALLLPLLMVLLLGIADFGRVFAASITIEAAARNGAEAAAQEYLQLSQQGSLDQTDYDHLHAVALEKVCQEAETLPNFAPGGSGCSMPMAAVCVHDGNDLTGCGTEADPSLPDCSVVNGSWDDSNLGPTPGGAAALPYVEVRVCYRFTTLIDLHMQLPFGVGLSLGDVWIQKDREFTVAAY